MPGAENAFGVASETSREVDLEDKKLMMEAHATASRVLRDHRKTLEAVVRLLLKREVATTSGVCSPPKHHQPSGYCRHSDSTQTAAAVDRARIPPR